MKVAVPARPATSATFGWRPRLVIALVLAVWGVLAGRLIQIQWLGAAQFAESAARQRSYLETIPARPGDIVDRHGRLLAATVTAPSLYVVPDRIDEPRQVAAALAQALGLNETTVRERIERHADKQFLWIKRRLSESEVHAIKKLKLPPGSWGLRDEYLRKYPQGALAAHVLGLRSIDGEGRGGVEEAFDSVIRGRDGRRQLIRDARGRVIEVSDHVDEPPQHGRTVQLALDCVVQLFVERELDALMAKHKPNSACAIVLDPATCDVLAMASRPAFDPNAPVNVPDRAWTNTAIASMYEPGSTIKPVIVAWALQKGLIARDEEFDCEHGVYRMGRRLLHDHHPYGRLSVTDILVKSSNIGMAKIGERMTNTELYHALTAFGFGRRTGCGLHGELPGLVAPLRAWTSYSTGSIPMGHELAVTPLQLITAHAALANGGSLISPRIVLGHSDPLLNAADGPSDEVVCAPVVTRVVDDVHARWLIEGPLVEVVRRGTGKRAQLAGYTVFGKTGTAQKTDTASGTYSQTEHVSSFLCGAPAHDPRVLVLVVVDEPARGGQFGGEVAAPTAAEILHKTLLHLRVPPDAAEEK